jgi:hypothetical protein
MTFRIRYQLAGSHVYCRLYVGRSDETFALTGSFTLRVGEEFDALRAAFPSAEYIQDKSELRIMAIGE